jgi:aspartate kinase
MTTLIMKFGGTSVGSASAIKQAADIVLAQALRWERLVVVVSAMSGVTDSLTRGALDAASGDEAAYRAVVAELRVKHYRVVDELVSPEGDRSQLLSMVDAYLDEFAAFCRSIHVLGEVTPRAMDTVTSLGERINARILAALLRQQGGRSEAVDATELIVTDDTFQNAAPLRDASRARAAARLVPLLENGVIPVATGFVASTERGITTTLGRGGSDFSAAILGDCLDADEVWIWTDVDGVLSADPRLVPDARLIPVLSYSEVGELAYFGAKVLHPRTIRPVVERGIPLWVKNTFNPTVPGTRIAREPETANGTVKAVTTIRGLSMVTVEGRGMMGVPGIAARTFAAVASQGASVLMISQASSEQSICFIIPTQAVAAVIAAIEREMALELARRDIDRVWSVDDVVIVTAVGAGMRSTPGIAVRIFGALAAGNINVSAIAQGSSECSISLVVAADDAATAVQHIHREVILNGQDTSSHPGRDRSGGPALCTVAGRASLV